jgi:hypothetical protein
MLLGGEVAAAEEFADQDREPNLNHSPAPQSFSPVLSTNRWMGSALDGGRVTANVSTRRLSVEWSGTARSGPSGPMTYPISPSV